MEKLKFLKNKWVALSAGIVFALFLLICTVLSWSESSFSFTLLIELFIKLGLIALLLVGIFMEKRKLSVLSACAFLAYFVVNIFVKFGTDAKTLMDAKIPDGGYPAICIFYALGAFVLIGSLSLLFIKEVKDNVRNARLINLITCLTAFVLFLIGFIILLTKPNIAGSSIASGLTLLLLPCVDIVMAENIY